MRIIKILTFFISVVAYSAQATVPALSTKSINFVTVPIPDCHAQTATRSDFSSDSKTELRYRAVNKIMGQRDVDNYVYMYILGRKAADTGHLKSQLLMAELYLREKNVSYYTEFNPKQAKIYLDNLMQHNVARAFFLMSKHRSLFKTATSPQSAYLYQAAVLGDPDAMASVAKILQTVKRFPEANRLLTCALKLNGGGEALDDLAMDTLSAAGNDLSEWERGFGYFMSAAKSGYLQAFTGIILYDDKYFRPKFKHYYFTNPEYAKRMYKIISLADPLFYHDDISQKSSGKVRRVQGNERYRYPNLNKVLPFPPVKDLPPWNGDITVLLSDEDKRDYQADYDYRRMAKEVQVEGLL
jgi:TPR repeat protein